MNLLPILHSMLLASSEPADGPAVPTARARTFASNLPALPPTSRRLYLLRHGMTDWNKRGYVQGSGHDIPLNDEGKSQAAYAAEELAAVPLSCIASSHLSRASMTADAVRAHHPSAERCISKGFVEIDYGDELEGKCIHNDDDESKRLKTLFDTVSRDMETDPSVSYPGGENALEVETRIRKALHQLLNDRPNDRHVAVVGHGRSNKILLASLLYDDAKRFATIEQGNTAISVVDYDPGEDKWIEVVLNYVAHNDDRGAASGGRY